MTRAGRGERAQASVETALLLPVVVLALLLAIQVGLLARDRLVAVHAARVAARAVIVDPDEDAALRALGEHGAPVDRITLELSGDRRPGGVVTVTVRMQPTLVPVLGRLVGGVRITERLGALVEGGP